MGEPRPEAAQPGKATLRFLHTAAETVPHFQQFCDDLEACLTSKVAELARQGIGAELVLR
ncbi:MAG: hypothetical protein E6I52_25725 [Chloroflexi bacterium]|nr:MAG: hypothetical protein E6I52_25725 [Chloroflexota bacterium]